MIRRIAFTLLITGLLALSGCATRQTDTSSPEAQAATLLRQATSEGDASAKFQLQLAAAGQMLQAGRLAETKSLLISLEPMAAADKAQEPAFLLLSMRTAVHLTDAIWAKSISQAMPFKYFTRYDKSQQPEAAQLQAAIFGLAQEPLLAARTLIATHDDFDAVTQTQQNNQIWQWLKQADTMALQTLATQSDNADLQGWIELALTLRRSDLALDLQGTEIKNWTQRWPQHPIANQLPDELQMITQMSQNRPQHMALVLPLSGPLADAGKSVREGFFAAYYSDSEQVRDNTSIRIIDSNDKSFAAIYQELVGSKTELVIGPLDKNKLQEVLPLANRPVPILGLNYLDKLSVAPDNLYQFGLSAEDEARQLLKRLKQEGHTRVLLVAPAGSWGDRVVATLAGAAQENGLIILDSARVDRDTNLTKTMANLLAIDISKMRKQKLQQTIGKKMAFNVRRRQDADAMIMIAPPVIARQIRPLLSFYFSGDLPVYATSLVYGGQPDPQADADLNGIFFTDLPWTLDQHNLLREQLQQAYPNLSRQFDRLFALGADAYALSSRLKLLEAVPNNQISGFTGQLSMTPAREIEREQGWAKFVKGSPRKVPDLKDVPAEPQTQPFHSTNLTQSVGLVAH